MASRSPENPHDTVGTWAKQCFFAGRAAMETMLRPFDLGTTQWYILHHLVREGPTTQRDLGPLLRIERATLTVIVAALVRKGLVEQVTDIADQRRKLLHLTPAGVELWDRLPELSIVINETGFAGISEANRDTAIRVLRIATSRLIAFCNKEHDT